MDNFYSTSQRWETQTGLDRWLFCTWENVMQTIFQKIQDFFRRMKLGNKACCLKCILKQRRATDKKFLLENLQSALKSATVSWSHASTRRTLETEEKELGTAFQVMPPRISSCPEMLCCKYISNTINYLWNKQRNICVGIVHLSLVYKKRKQRISKTMVDQVCRQTIGISKVCTDKFI